MFAYMSMYLRLVEFAEEITRLNPNRQFGAGIELMWAQIGANLFCYVVTLVFLFQIRRNARKRPEQA